MDRICLHSEREAVNLKVGSSSLPGSVIVFTLHFSLLTHSWLFRGLAVLLSAADVQIGQCFPLSLSHSSHNTLTQSNALLAVSSKLLRVHSTPTIHLARIELATFSVLG